MSYIGKTPTAVPLTSSDITNGIITTAKIADDAISAAKLASGVGGKVLQVQSTTKLDTFSGSAGGGAYVDVTGLSVAITPSATSSKILVMATVCGCNSVNTTSPQNSIGFKIIRGSTSIAIGNAASSRTRVGVMYSDPSADQRNIAAISLEHLDAPSSTSEQTYKIAITQGYSGGAVTMYVNRTDGDPDNYSGIRAVSSITVMEVAG